MDKYGNQGVKHDQDKIQVELLSTLWLLGVGRVLTFGAKKYAAHNWRHGIKRSRLLGAALRHVLAYMGGEDRDQESGLSHLHHASCCLMFASELHETRPDLDDRWKEPKTCPACGHHDCLCMKEPVDTGPCPSKSVDEYRRDLARQSRCSHEWTRTPRTDEGFRVYRCLKCLASHLGDPLSGAVMAEVDNSERGYDDGGM